MKSFFHALEYAAFLSIHWFVGLVPLDRARKIGGAVARFIGKRLGFRWSIARENVRHAFPDRPDSWHEEMAAASFASVGITLFELLRFDRLTPEDFSRLVTLEDDDVLRAACASGKGVILLTAHYGSWEIIPHAVTVLLGVSTTVLVRGLANPHIDRAVDRLRRTFGAVTVPSTVAVRELYRTLQRGGMVFMAADQSAAQESTRVRFFGRMTPAFEGPAVLALRTGALIVFTVARRLPDGRYQMHFDPIPVHDLDPDDPAAAQRLTERYMVTTERAIREEPSQWMWMHRRWKHTVPTS